MTNSYTHTWFHKAYAKKKSNSNAKVKGVIIMWPIYTTLHVCINLTSKTKKFYASYKGVAKQAMSLDCQLAKKDYLQIKSMPF